MIRKWLCSAFRVGPQRPVSEVPDLPSHPAARPPILASFRGEILYFQPPANQKRKLLYDLASFRCLPPAPSTLSSIARRPRPTTTTRTPASPSGAALDAMAAAGCPPRLMLLPAPGPWPPAPGPRPPRVTHLAKKRLPMRHKISRRHRNPLKKRSLKPREYEFHIPGADASSEYFPRVRFEAALNRHGS